MLGMVTGDQDKIGRGGGGSGDYRVRMKGGDAGTPDADGAGGFVETEPVHCTCEWAVADTGSNFYARVSNPDPDCAVHRR